MKILKKCFKFLGIIFLFFMIYNSIIIGNYASEHSEQKSDVAIILGAGTANGIISPVFRERIHHGVYLYENNIVTKLIFTGGKGNGQDISDSELAKQYAIEQGVAPNDIFIEEKSRYTHENLTQAKLLMDANNFKTALIVSDPIHMKRSMELAAATKIECESSPTTTSLYKSTFEKLKFLGYETCFYTLGKLTFQF